MQKKKLHIKNKINHSIQAENVRLVISDQDTQIVSLSEALKRAEAQGLDLVEVAAPALEGDIPVCKIFDYEKRAYEKQKKGSGGSKKKHRSSDTKELKFSVNIEDHDYNTKLKKIQEFIEKGDKVKCCLKFTGREKLHVEMGQKVFENLINDTEKFVKIEHPPTREGNQIIMVISPKGSSNKG